MYVSSYYRLNQTVSERRARENTAQTAKQKMEDLLKARHLDHADKRQKTDVAGACAQHDVLAVSNPGILNASNPSDLATVLAATGADAAPVRSDCDEQLLVNLTLAQTSKIHSIRLGGPDADTAPKTVKLFINRAALSFDDVEDLPPTQTLTLSGQSATLPLQFVKFQSVSTLTVFIEGNQSDGDVTQLSHLSLIGTPLHTTNMSDLKKGG